MRKVFVLFCSVALVTLLFPARALAGGGASFSISGPNTLEKGEIGTFTVKVTLSDAAAAQATLEYDSGFFALVSGNVHGEYDSASNTSTTVTLTTVKLRCIADMGTSGSLSLSGKKASRYTGGDPPVESVSCSGGSKTVKNPVPTPTPVQTPVPPPDPTKKPSTNQKPKPSQSLAVTPEPTATPLGQIPWPEVEASVNQGPSGEFFSVRIQDNAQVPITLLQTLKNKKSKLELVFAGYTCSIDGKDLNSMPGDIACIDLMLDMQRDETLSACFGGKDMYQLHFDHHGELPGPFTFSIKAENSQPGDAVYLYYYYDAAGVIEGVQTAVVDANGYITFTICHCSTYVFTSDIIQGAIGPLGGTLQAAQNMQAQGISLAVFLICIAAAVFGSAFVTQAYCKKGRKVRAFVRTNRTTK